MMIAQQLYEGVDIGSEGSVGLITYMRTDSVRISEDALTEARKYILIISVRSICHPNPDISRPNLHRRMRMRPYALPTLKELLRPLKIAFL